MHGIAASRLDERGGGNIWPFELLNKFELPKLTLDPTKEQGDIFVSDVWRKDKIDAIVSFEEIEIFKPLLDMLTDPLRGRYREYQVERNPDRRTPAGCDVTQRNLNPTLFVFAYDWRKSNVESATALRDYISCIQQFYPNSKVDILAHSMGGSVARRYILDNPGTHEVQKLVTIGTPWLGAPKAINVMETGVFIERVLGAPGFIRDPVLAEHKALAKFFPGVHELLPSRPLFPLVFGNSDCTTSPFCEQGVDINNNGDAFEEYTYDQFTTHFNRRFSPSEAGTNGSAFHDHPGQDDWRNDASGVQYLHIVGLKPVADTIGRVIPDTFSRCDTSQMGTGVHICATEILRFNIETTKGDGTVPIVSAERVVRDDSSPLRILENLNAPGAEIRVFFDLPNNGSEHTELTKRIEVHLRILSFLGRRRPPIVAPPVGAQRALVSQAEPEPLPAVKPALYLNVTGAIGINVADPFGNNTNQPSDTNITTLGNVPGVSEYITGEDSRFIVIDPEREYTVTFRSGADPIVLEVTKGTDITTTMATRYQDLNLPEGAEAMLKINPDTAGGVERLRSDNDGDGTFETEVVPKVETEGPDAADTVAPTLRMRTTVINATATRVTLSATDTGSGVKDVFFSLDGTRFHRYTSAFRINRARIRFIHVFADDNVANRSSTVTFRIPRPGDDGS